MTGAPVPVAEPRAERPKDLSLTLMLAALVVAGSVVLVAVLSLIVRHGAGFGSLDWRILRFFRDFDGPLAVNVSSWLADIGRIETLLVIAAGLGLLLYRQRLHPVLCSVPLVSLLVAGAFVQIIKVAIPRSSPYAYFRFGHVATGSFPSGHAADTTAVCVGLAIVVAAVWLRRPLERVVVFGLAAGASVAVGLSRLVLGVHWPTDVLAGWAIGLATATVVGTLAIVATQDHPFLRGPGPRAGTQP